MAGNEIPAFFGIHVVRSPCAIIFPHQLERIWHRIPPGQARFMRHIFLGLVILLGSAGGAAAADLQIYFIDVEGGQSTLIVTPSHQSLLVDTGFPSNGTFASKPGDPHKARDANRIAAVAAAAGVKAIDYL